jgi:hypothetical protein
MSLLFPRWTNSVFRSALVLLVLAPGGFAGLLLAYARTPFMTGQHDSAAQPVQFDHRHHVTDDGIDCRYCHQTVETSAYAGLPSTATCMGCHAQIWNKSPLLDEVRQAWFEDRPIPWIRVNRVPQFVYFNHAIHVHKGVGCETCHGRVDQMPTGTQAVTLQMDWCLGCHRDPSPHLRPVSAITAMGWQGPAQTPADLHTRTNCTTCHR